MTSTRLLRRWPAVEVSSSDVRQLATPNQVIFRWSISPLLRQWFLRKHTERRNNTHTNNTSDVCKIRKGQMKKRNSPIEKRIRGNICFQYSIIKPSTHLRLTCWYTASRCVCALYKRRVKCNKQFKAHSMVWCAPLKGTIKVWLCLCVFWGRKATTWGVVNAIRIRYSRIEYSFEGLKGRWTIDHFFGGSFAVTLCKWAAWCGIEK